MKIALSFLSVLALITTTIHAASTPQTILIVKPSHTIVNGKDSLIYTIEQPDGSWGFVGTEGNEFNALVKNTTDVPITIHWHGLIVPNDQDGVPYLTQNPIPAGGNYSYHFKLIQNGTYWMHSHYKMQMQEGFFAPLIIKDPHDPYSEAKDVTMLISDFSFKSPETINQELRTAKMSMSNMDHMNMPMDHMNMSMNSGKPDLNDVQYDAYLINHHEATNPEKVAVTPGQLVRLRIIDGGSASNFFINLGELQGQVVATDGNYIKPLSGSIFSISEGQRLDILIKIPQEDSKKSYPILAQAEGTQQQTGLLLLTHGAQASLIPPKVKQNFGAIDALQDHNFHALHPLPAKSITRKIKLSLEGGMSPYVWKINNEAWPNITPIKVATGERIEMDITNHTNMSHPIHLHGHVFQIISINGEVMSDGPLRDTVLVPAQGKVSIIFDSNNTGNWMLHCHVLYHSEDGMMTVMHYDDAPKPKLMAH